MILPHPPIDFDPVCPTILEFATLHARRRAFSYMLPIAILTFPPVRVWSPSNSRLIRLIPMAKSSGPSRQLSSAKMGFIRIGNSVVCNTTEGNFNAWVLCSMRLGMLAIIRLAMVEPKWMTLDTLHACKSGCGKEVYTSLRNVALHPVSLTCILLPVSAGR